MTRRRDSADQLGLHFAKLERLRRKGLIPEAARVGRYYVFPSDQIAAIRARLVAAGHIRAPEVACNS